MVLTLVNTDVVANEEVNTIQTTKKEAETMGAIAFFGDKYGDRVRVVRAGAHSLEFCGGTHVDRLGDIGQIQIVSEASIGSNTRRIEGVSAMGAYQRSHDMETALGSVAAILKSSVDDVVPALERIMERQREFEKELSSLRQAQLSRFAEELHAQVTSDVVVARVDGYPGEQLRALAADDAPAAGSDELIEAQYSGPKQAMRPVLIGLVIGVAICAALSRLMSVMLYGVSPFDPLTFFGVALFLTGVALLACYLPARRATRVDPMEALRYE